MYGIAKYELRAVFTWVQSSILPGGSAGVFPLIFC